MIHPRARNLALVLPGPAILLTAALVPAWRLPTAIVLAVIVVTLWASRRRVPVALAAALPLAVALTWPALLGVDAPLGPIGCIDPFAVIA